MLKRGNFKSKALVRQRPTLIQIIRSLGLTNGLQICLDAGDIESYSGDTNLWKDTSGNDNHFYLGSGANSSDIFKANFHGTPGRKSELEFFTAQRAEDGTSFPCGFNISVTSTFDDAWVKDGGKFSCISIFRQAGTGASAADNIIFLNNVGTSFSTPSLGFSIVMDTTRDLIFRYDTTDAAGGIVTITLANSLINNYLLSFAGVSFDETGNILLRSNQLSSTTAATASALTLDPPQDLAIGNLSDFAATNAYTPLLHRFHMFAIWSGVALTDAQMNSIRTEIRNQRFGNLA